MSWFSQLLVYSSRQRERQGKGKEGAYFQQANGASLYEQEQRQQRQLVTEMTRLTWVTVIATLVSVAISAAYGDKDSMGH